MQHQQLNHNNQHLPTYPHLFQHAAGHAVISQMPLQAQGQGVDAGDAGDEVDEDVDEDEEDNGDDEADEDGLTTAGGLGITPRRSLHHAHTHSHRHGPSSHGQSSRQQQGRTLAMVDMQQNGPSQNTSVQGSTFAPPPYYRTNHRMTGRVGELLDDGTGSTSSSTSPPGPASVPALAASSHASYANAGRSPQAASFAHEPYHQSLQNRTNGTYDSAWLSQMSGNEPTTQIRGPHITFQAASPANLANPQAGRSATRPFTPTRGPTSSAQPAASLSETIVRSGASAQDSIMDSQQDDAADARQRSHSVDMDLNTEDEPQIGFDMTEDGLSRTARPRRDTIMQANYRQDS